MTQFAGGAALALAVLAVLLSGWASVWAVWSGTRTGVAVAVLRAALALGLGLGWWSGLYSVLLFLGHAQPAALLATDGALGLAGGLAVFLRMRQPSPGAAPVYPAAPARLPVVVGGILLVMLLVTAISFVALTGTNPEGGQDAWVIWNLRARYLFRSEDGLQRALAVHPLSHPDYPVLLPGLVVQGWRLLGSDAPAVPTVIAGLYGLVALGTLVFSLVLLRGWKTGLLAGIVLLGTPFFLLSATYRMADLPLAAYAVMAGALIALAVDGIPERRHGLLTLAGLAMSMGAYTKNEGMLYLAGFSAALVLWPSAPTPGLRPRLQSLAFFLLGALPFLMLWVWYKKGYAPQNDLLGSWGAARLLSPLMKPERYYQLAATSLKKISDIEKWNCFWFVLPVILVAFGRRSVGTFGLALLTTALAFVALGFTAVLLLTPYDTAWHVNESLDRLLLQCWPLALLASFLALAPWLDASAKVKPGTVP